MTLCVKNWEEKQVESLNHYVSNSRARAISWKLLLFPVAGSTVIYIYNYIQYIYIYINKNRKKWRFIFTLCRIYYKSSRETWIEKPLAPGCQGSHFAKKRWWVWHPGCSWMLLYSIGQGHWPSMFQDLIPSSTSLCSIKVQEHHLEAGSGPCDLRKDPTERLTVPHASIGIKIRFWDLTQDLASSSHIDSRLQVHQILWPPCAHPNHTPSPA